MKIPLHNYQVYAKDFVLTHPFCGMFLQMGLGKAIDDETIIPTPKGEKQIKDILPGDTVFGYDGKEHTVTAIYPHKNEPAYEITLDDGRSFICSHEHLITYTTQNGKKFSTETAETIKKMLENKQHVYIPLCEPVEYPEVTHIIPPQEAGMMLGQPSYDVCPTFGTNVSNIDIPKEYIYDSAKNRMALLRCIIMDGYWPRCFHRHRLDTFKGYNINKTCTFATESEALANTVVKLCNSLGIVATILPTYEFDGTHTSTYVLRIYYDFNKRTKTKQKNKILYIKDVPSRNMTCFTIDAPDSLYLINDHIVTHNTSIVLESLWEMNPTHHVLIIAPKNIARCTWVNEIKKWDMNIRTQSLVVNERGKQLTKKKREEIYASIPSSPPTVYFINREMLVQLEKAFPASKNKWCFPTVIIDESQSFKSYNSERFKVMKKIRPYLQRLILLTGSPQPKGIEDLWPQIYMLDMGQRLGPNISRFRDVYCNPGFIKGPTGYPINWTPKYGAEQEIYRKISDIVISMKNKYIQLPPITFNNMYAEMDPDEYKRYKQFMKTSVLELTNGEEIEAANAAVLSAKLSQMASGSIYTDARTHTYELIHTHKLELCEYIINNTNGNVIIAYHFQSEKDMLLKYLNEHDIPTIEFDGSPELESKWNQKQIKCMILQPASCGFGLNLQHGGSTLIWYTLPWSLEHYEQTNARIYRQGQTEPVIIHQLMTKDTIDTRILEAIAKKDLSQQRLINAVEATIKD